jgi:indolepyruvate ferredoxin oxidoreductase alpha subunit
LRDPRVLLENRLGTKYLLLGNEAVVRGAIEAGVHVVTTYPGTPASEIGDTISRIAGDAEIYMEYSTNEKVALEVAAGTSFAGARALTAMKMVGLNVASDMLVSLGYTGVRGGLVVVVADDPDCFSSQDEQDSRYYALLANIPCLEPSNPQEARDMLLSAFEISEKLELPVVLRLATRVSHTRGIVSFGQIRRTEPGSFVRDTKRFVMVPENARRAHRALLEKMRLASKISERSPHNKVVGRGSVGLVTSGVSYNYSSEALKLLGGSARILKIGMVNPLPVALTTRFLRTLRRVVVVEELEPLLEVQVRAIVGGMARRPKVCGKLDELFPRYGEFSTRLVAVGLSKALGKTLPTSYERTIRKAAEAAADIPPRPPVLCPGCPHIASFRAIRVATEGRAIVSSDIGCYTLGYQPPYSVGDLQLCMGSSVGIASGLSKFSDDTVIGVVGDSTFFHGAIPGLINAVYNNHKFVYVVLDNMTTAMTGHQPHPGTGTTATGSSSRRVLIEDLAKACGVEYVRVVDPFEHKAAVSTIQEAILQNGPAVVVFRRACVQIKAPVEGSGSRGGFSLLGAGDEKHVVSLGNATNVSS